MIQTYKTFPYQNLAEINQGTGYKVGSMFFDTYEEMTRGIDRHLFKTLTELASKRSTASRLGDSETYNDLDRQYKKHMMIFLKSE